MAGTHTAALLLAPIQSLPGIPPAARLLPGNLALPAALQPPASPGNRLLGALHVTRIGLYGAGFIEGDVALKALPNNVLVGRRVLLFRERDGACFGELWSHPTTGYFRFNNTELDVPYTAVAYDGPRVFKAAVQDALYSERL